MDDFRVFIEWSDYKLWKAKRLAVDMFCSYNCPVIVLRSKDRIGKEIFRVLGNPNENADQKFVALRITHSQYIELDLHEGIKMFNGQKNDAAKVGTKIHQTQRVSVLVEENRDGQGNLCYRIIRDVENTNMKLKALFSDSHPDVVLYLE
ncbi:hypothetical protein PSKAS_06660 [Peribacillus sp. N1]